MLVCKWERTGASLFFDLDVTGRSANANGVVGCRRLSTLSVSQVCSPLIMFMTNPMLLI